MPHTEKLKDIRRLSVMPGRDGAPNRAQQHRLDELRATRDRVWDTYLGIQDDQERLAQAYDQWSQKQTQESIQTIMAREYKRNWESRDNALDKAALEKLREHAEIGKTVEQLKDSWRKK